ncbi:GNAT family N-acetyltransferase [Pseudooceanicola sp. 216_PA32_1]|uniref:GNAT family N-acetyltransferase n=1 Tax=Pseudooceanicola pacificus TaxID=2676438 RepID=A0A844W6L6_9RHOB|nr:GNAT family N-acetyltransferase [Pseudooceanicola pacificus]MWB78715.1 GNAT family N-acetyltransferase [Pseudooceanicola pacificus]
MTPASPLAAAAPEINIIPFEPAHIEGALRLSQEAGWPHRAEDWGLTLSVSRGVVALQGDEVVGTALCSLFGEVAAINMIIVDARMRGRGLGRKLMQAVLDIASPREQRLTATEDGLPLYEKLGFVVVGEIIQHQGIARAAEAEEPVQVNAPADLAELAAMDHAASGMDRRDLIAGILKTGELLRAERGFALLRLFGRGKVLGPVVAQDAATARALIAAGATRAAGEFLRIDLPDWALAPFAESLGLAHVGGGTAMTRAARAAPDTDYTTFALASQALG